MLLPDELQILKFKDGNYLIFYKMYQDFKQWQLVVARFAQPPEF